MPLVVVPLKIHGASNNAELVVATCLPPPITYARTVHAPVTVSAEEFSKVLSGAVVAHSVGFAVDTSSGTEQILCSQENTGNELVKPTKQMKIKTKRRACC